MNYRLLASTAAFTFLAAMVLAIPEPVLCGVDVLKRTDFRALAGRKVGIVTNHSGRDREGNHLVTLLLRAADVKVVCLFSPEHGFSGLSDTRIDDGIDEKTGLVVHSLYGSERKPTARMLAGVDTLVFDIADVGARFYTFASTLGLCMEAAAENQIAFFVLDRPNPITGRGVDGPIADADKLNFVGYKPIPVAHGMTLGELAQLYRGHFGIACDLRVVKMENWRRAMWFDETGLPWINPSPNIRNLSQALLYSGVCLLEQTNVSVGRGTDQPFERFGAPWMDGQKVAAALNAENLPGLRFYPERFTPQASRFQGENCGGVHILVTDRDAVEPVRLGIALLWHLRTLFGDAFELERSETLLKSAATLAAIKSAKTPAEVPAVWHRELAEFLAVREKYLIYP